MVEYRDFVQLHYDNFVNVEDEVPSERLSLIVLEDGPESYGCDFAWQEGSIR